MNKIIKNEKSILLSGGITVIAEIRRDGQQLPHEGNNIVVAARLYLPALQDDIREDIVFKDKLSILGEDLQKNWGFRDEKKPNFSFREEKIVESTWGEGFRKAEALLFVEIRKLNDTLESRAKALRDAEE